METIADVIKLLQNDHSMPLEQLARFFDVSYMTLWAWKKGQAKPSYQSILKVAERLKEIKCDEGIAILRRIQ